METGIQNLNQYVDTLFANMKSFSQMDGLIGKPVTQGDKTFLPVISVTVGYGGGDSLSKANGGASAGTAGKQQGRMMGDAMGIGAKLCTDAIIVIDKDNVFMAPIGGKGGMAQMLEKIPQIIGNMSGQGGQQGGLGNQQQNQQQQSQTY